MTHRTQNLIRSIVKELNLDKEVYKLGIIQNRISSLKNNFITPKGYNNHPELTQTDLKCKEQNLWDLSLCMCKDVSNQELWILTIYF